MEIEIRLESRLYFLTFYAWPRKYKNEALCVCEVLCFLKKLTKTLDNFDLLNKLNFVQILKFLRQF